MNTSYQEPRPSMLNRFFGFLYSPWGVALLVLVVTGVRLGMLSSEPVLPLMPGEARPWLLGLSPRPGYVDAAPLLPWLLGLVSDTCGSATPCLRLGAPITHGLVTWVMYLLASRLFDARTGFWTALTYTTLPMVLIGSLVIDDMALLLLAWAVGLHALARLTHPNLLRFRGKGDWVILGASVGVGLLAHPVMILFCFAALSYIVVSSEFRGKRLWSGLFLAVLTAVILHGPVLAWNATHDWAGYQRVWTALMSTRPDAWTVGRDFLIGVLMFGPVLAIALIRALVRLPWELRAGAFADYRVRLLALFTMPVLVLSFALALMPGEGITLTEPAVLGACLLVVGWKVVQEALIGLRVSVVVNLLVFALATGGVPLAQKYGWVPPAWADPAAAGRGWSEAGPWMKALAEAYPDTPIGVAGDAAPMMVYYAREAGVAVREVGAGPDPGATFKGLLVMPEALAVDGGDIRARLTILLDDGRRSVWAAVMVPS